MTVVSNSSPLCYLSLIGELHLLYVLFGQVLMPPAVEMELGASGSPPEVQYMLKHRPDWLKVHPFQSQPAEALVHLHAGERDAILLAEQINADIILLDEKRAREAASSRGLRLTGLLGVLDEAAARKLVDLPQAVERLRKTNFRVTPVLLKRLLERHITGSST